jgi:hypothetical protein
MSDIKIDKNIKIPKGRTGSKYPFDKMEVGDSFLYPIGSTRNQARCSAYTHSTKGLRKFVIRQTEEGLRCWRVE